MHVVHGMIESLPEFTDEQCWFHRSDESLCEFLLGDVARDSLHAASRPDVAPVEVAEVVLKLVRITIMTDRD